MYLMGENPGMVESKIRIYLSFALLTLSFGCNRATTVRRLDQAAYQAASQLIDTLYFGDLASEKSHNIIGENSLIREGGYPFIEL